MLLAEGTLTWAQGHTALAPFMYVPTALSQAGSAVQHPLAKGLL